ncbi:NAD(P)H-dependent oxidoreductase [Acinetobacter puyangensis]|uniref:NAD(P)H-dependent FMN reductase n=2 Tax=Acinetobacter puyangensis TaxID=1096779 RepID=A0A240ECY0_9GAMM|nr:NAD(P)H-dependent FMN reductase [Acinetobacter puyangensis]
MMKIQIIVGSVREGRVAIQVAEWMLQALADFNQAEIELVDLKQWNLPIYSGASPLALNRNYSDPSQQKWSEKILEADAYILISPEYNHGYSPALKNALDYLGTEWKNKAVAFASYGSSNGARSIEHLRAVTVQLGLIDNNLALEIRDIFARTKAQNFVGNEFEQKLLVSIAAQLVELAKKLK